MGGVADPRYTQLPTCVTTSNLVVVTKYVHINRREQPKLGSTGTPHGVGARLTLRTSLLPKRIVKVGSSAKNGVRINRKEPQKLGNAVIQPPWCGGVVDPKKYIPPHVCYPAECGRSISNGTRVTKDIRLKMLTILSRLSRPLKVIETDYRYGSIRRL